MKRSMALSAAVILVAVCWAFAAAAEDDPTSFDILITGGRVIDPLSGVDALLDIGISNGRIVYVGEPGQSGRDGLERLDATGHVVSPGFIDVHVHGQNPLSSDFMVRDGVTTALDLELGAHGVADFLWSRRGKARIHYGVAAGHMPARLNQAYGISTGHLLTRGSGFMAAFTRFLQRWVQPTGWATETLDAKGIDELLSILEEQLDEAGTRGWSLGVAFLADALDGEVDRHDEQSPEAVAIERQVFAALFREIFVQPAVVTEPRREGE